MIFSILILTVLRALVHQVYPFPPGYDSTTDPWVAGFPIVFYRLWSIQLSPIEWTTTNQFYWVPFVVDFVFWAVIVFVIDFTYTRGYSEILKRTSNSLKTNLKIATKANLQEKEA